MKKLLVGPGSAWLSAVDLAIYWVTEEISSETKKNNLTSVSFPRRVNCIGKYNTHCIRLHLWTSWALHQHRVDDGLSECAVPFNSGQVVSWLVLAHHALASLCCIISIRYTSIDLCVPRYRATLLLPGPVTPQTIIPLQSNHHYVILFFIRVSTTVGPSSVNDPTVLVGVTWPLCIQQVGVSQKSAEQKKNHFAYRLLRSTRLVSIKGKEGEMSSTRQLPLARPLSAYIWLKDRS